jgi:alpha-maltose-1-phosphate synthase
MKRNQERNEKGRAAKSVPRTAGALALQFPRDGQIMILAVGGDAASKGAQEVMQALALIDAESPDWRYVCKVWPQPRTVKQNHLDLELAKSLGIDKKVIYSTNVVSHNFMPYLLASCDIYAAPSRLEGFGM